MASNTIRKPELDAAVAEALGMSKELAGEIVASVLEEIILGVAQDGQVQILGFGSFVRRHRNARSGRNPRDGGVIEIAAHEAVIFRAGTKLKLAVNH
ncbi:MAG: HU family DNA-binding protein [Pseudomonadales bacterium]|nr:HU family DNA-binding protein [Pseudomonadales bacterium]